MAMAKKHLRELLCEDQEPFFLLDYVNERRSQLHKPELTLRLCRAKLTIPVLSDALIGCSTSFFSVKSAPSMLVSAPRIHKQTKGSKPRNKIGYFGSMLKGLVMRKRHRKRGVMVDEQTPTMKGSLRWESLNREVPNADDASVEKAKSSCSCNSSVWTDCIEKKSTDLESSTSGSDQEFEEMEFIKQRRSSCDSVSVVRLLQSLRLVMDGMNGGEGFNCKNEDKKKEHFSPVSVMDPPFVDDDERQEEDGQENETAQYNFAYVQRTKLMLLEKIRRFEMMALLDDDDTVSYSRGTSEEDENCYYENLVHEVLIRSQTCQWCMEFPKDMKMLALDLMEEEKEVEPDSVEMGELKEKLCKRLMSWKTVESSTYDMIVEMDYQRDDVDWKNKSVEVDNVGLDVELAILDFLLTELSSDLIHLKSV